MDAAQDTLRSQDIAPRLGVSVRIVNRQVRSAMDRNDCRDRRELLERYRRDGCEDIYIDSSGRRHDTREKR